MSPSTYSLSVGGAIHSSWAFRPQLGVAAGQSTEFMDHRVYVAGDDVRRIDWNATARTDQLLIKRYQEEIRVPSVVLLVDDSKSMSVYEDKLARAKEGWHGFISRSPGLEASTKAILLHKRIWLSSSH